MKENRPRNRQNLTREISRLQQQWELINDKLDRLENQRIRETRADEKFRLEHSIEEIQTERDQIYQRLEVLQSRLAKTNSEAKGSTGRNDDHCYSESSNSTLNFQENSKTIVNTYYNIEALKEQHALLSEKIGFLKKEKITTTDPSTAFDLERKIEKLSNECIRVSEQIISEERRREIIAIKYENKRVKENLNQVTEENKSLEDRVNHDLDLLRSENKKLQNALSNLE